MIFVVLYNSFSKKNQSKEQRWHQLLIIYLFLEIFPVFRIKCLCFLVVEATCSWKPQHSIRRYCACVAELSILTSVCAQLQVCPVVQSTVYLNVFVQALSVCSPGFVRLPLSLARHFGDFSTGLFVQRICGIHSQGGLSLSLPAQLTICPLLLPVNTLTLLLPEHLGWWTRRGMLIETEALGGRLWDGGGR